MFLTRLRAEPFAWTLGWCSLALVCLMLGWKPMIASGVALLWAECPSEACTAAIAAVTLQFKPLLFWLYCAVIAPLVISRIRNAGLGWGTVIPALVMLGASAPFWYSVGTIWPDLTGSPVSIALPNALLAALTTLCVLRSAPRDRRLAEIVRVDMSPAVGQLAFLITLGIGTAWLIFFVRPTAPILGLPVPLLAFSVSLGTTLLLELAVFVLGIISWREWRAAGNDLASNGIELCTTALACLVLACGAMLLIHDATIAVIRYADLAEVSSQLKSVVVVIQAAQLFGLVVLPFLIAIAWETGPAQEIRLEAIGLAGTRRQSAVAKGDRCPALQGVPHLGSAMEFGRRG